MFKESKISQRLRKLEQHLKQENPILSDVVQGFRELDRITRRLGFFNREESHATRTPWWPLISVLGIYSAGKSTFINNFLQYELQAVGIQAVDDKYSVICFTGDQKNRVLPGLALDADPRFPLYKISQAIEEVAQGEGEHIDAYLQLKTCPSEKLRGKILIDSPGFDADAQRTSTLRITDHIIDLSDLVLVFFDARHPETGSMRDTLEHLVKATVNRRDSNKFLYI
ncbi:MAG: dynamin family protein, partial [Desulfobacterales bacterium]